MKFRERNIAYLHSGSGAALRHSLSLDGLWPAWPAAALRGGLEGFSVASLGMLGTTWAGGFVAGCIFAPRPVRRVGHVRAFGCFAASAAIIALLSGIYIDAISWIILRTFTGFSMAGAFMVIESWLNERATNESVARFSASI